MDITKNGVPQYGYINQKYTKTGQLISNELPVILDKNSPVIQFESDYVKDKIVKLFGGNVIPGEITEQEAALVSNTYFNSKGFRLFYDLNKAYEIRISFNELKYFSQVTYLPDQMFMYCLIHSIEFPKNLKQIGDNVFYSAKFEVPDFIIPDSVTTLGMSTFMQSNLRSLTGSNIIYTYGNIAYSMFNLEELNLPKLKEVKRHTKFPKGMIIFKNNSKLKSINLPELQRINTIYSFIWLCPNLEEIICPKLQDLSLPLHKNTSTKVNKIILSNNIDNILYYLKDKSVLMPNTIQLGLSNSYIQNPDSEYTFASSYTRYNNFLSAMPILTEDLSNARFSNYISCLNNIPNTYSKVKINTETFSKGTTNLGFAEIHIVKSASKKIEKFTLGNSACLQKLFLETDIKEIDDLAFKYCPSLKEVHLNQELEKIGSFAFALYAAMYPALWALPEDKVHYLQLFNIPKNVNNIGDNPLLGQEQLTKTTLTLDPENKNFILENGILYNKNKTKIILATCDVQIDRIPDTVTEIGAGAFAFNKYTGELTIPSTVKKIGYLAFAYSKFQSIKFEDSIDNIIFEKTGNNILYIFNYIQNITLSNFYGMSNPIFEVQGQAATKNQLNILTLNQNIDLNNCVKVTLPNTLYSNDYDLVVPVGVKAYTYKKSEDTFVKSKTYNEGDIIPKGEAVALEGEAGQYSFPIIRNQKTKKDVNNVLIGVDKDTEGSGNYYIFNNGSIELSGDTNIIKENTVYIKKD